MPRKTMTTYLATKRRKLPLERVASEYLADLRLRNLSDLTINLYAGFLRRFEKALSNGKTPLSLAEVAPELARGYLTSRMQQDTIYNGHPLHPQETHCLTPHTNSSRSAHLTCVRLLAGRAGS